MNPLELWDRLSDRDRRALQLGALVLLPALAWVFGVSPYLDAVEERRSRLDTRTSLLQAERDLIAGRDRYPERVKTAAARLQRMAPALLDSRSRGVATAELTQYLEDRAAALRVRLTATEPGPVRRVGPRLVAVPVTVEAESDLQGLLGFLDVLEDGTKLLRVDDLRLRRRSGAARRQEEGMEVLALHATVVGYMLFPESRTDDGASAGDGVASDGAGGRPGSSLAGRSGGAP